MGEARALGLLVAVVLSTAATARAQDFAPPQMPGAILRPRPRPPCGVETRVRGRRTREGIVLEVWLRNRTKAPVPVTMTNACIGGTAQLYGVPQGYDVYSGCNRGACVATPPPMQVVLPAGAEDRGDDDRSRRGCLQWAAAGGGV